MRKYLMAALLAASGSATAAVQPFNNLQPSLAVTEVINPTGIYPSQGGGSAMGDMLGFVYGFAGTYAPGSTLSALGQVLPINQNQALFSILGTTYGGDGSTNFALPNLAGRAVIGAGSGAQLGVPAGSASVTLTNSQLPAVQNQQPFSNVQPSLPLQTLIATNGIFPSPNSSSGASFIGQIANFTGNFAPGGWAAANGQLLSISQNTALFSVIGTTYGGDGKTTFALPDLQGRVAVGASNTVPIGTTFGQTSTTLTQAQINGAPVSNYQPSLAVNYLIATTGVFPSQGGGAGFDQTTPTLGEITAFAGNYAPGGWALANGQLLSIQQNQALFAILGTTYGGDGITTFALPDLQGRTLIGADNVAYLVGGNYGTAQITLGANNLPVPEPETWAMLLAGLGLLSFTVTRRMKAAATA